MSIANKKKTESEMTFIEVHRRKQIIETAINLILRNGYQKTTIISIAKEAGFSKGVIFYYFENKEELAIQINQVLIEEFRVYTRQQIKNVTPISDMLKAYVEAYLRFIKKNRDKFSVLMEIGINLNLSTKDPIFSAQTFFECRRDLSKLLDKDGKLEKFSNKTSNSLSAVLQGMLDGLGIQYIADNTNTIDLKACQDIIFDIIDSFFQPQ